MSNNKRRPYLQPLPLTCDPEKIRNGISMDLVDTYIDKHERRFVRYDYLEKLYDGFHDIFRQPEKPEWKPDHRLAVNFPFFITEVFTGYAYGIPIKVSHEDEAVNEAIASFGRNNEITDHDAEMATKCCIFGHAFEYFYQNEDARTKVKDFSPKNLFVVYDDTVEDRALFAIRYGYFTDDTGRKKRRYGEILTREEITTFVANEKKEIKPNPYGYIPVVEWRLNDKRRGLYEPAAILIEEFNLIISEKGNDVAAFAEAYLSIIGAEADEEDVKRIRDDRVINFYGTDDAREVLVQFLTKPTADGTQENLLNRLQDLIFLTCMAANISDDTFGNASSGVSLAYKLLAMDNMANKFDRKIEKSLRKRFKIFCSLSTNVSDPDAWEDIEISFSRNVPKNLQEEATIARSLEGVVSKRTQLKVLSIVDNVDEEIEQIQDEENKGRESIVDLRMFGSSSVAQGNDSEEIPEEVTGDGDES